MYAHGGLSFKSENDFNSGILEPDVILPSYLTKKNGKELKGGIRKLMAALLSDGVEAYITHAANLSHGFGNRLGTPELAQDAFDWVETRDDSYVFSFDNVCESLGIDAEYLRLGLKRYLEAIRLNKSSVGTGKNVWKKIRRPRK